MKTNLYSIKAVILFLSFTIFLASCVSSTLIQSNPSGATLYIDGEKVGHTPYRYSDTKIIGAMTFVKLEKTGYETLYTNFSRDEEADAGAIVGGIFFIFPFLWTMKYYPNHEYELIPIENYDQPLNSNSDDDSFWAKTEKLKELKKLLDNNTITPEEFEKEKHKLFEENNK